MFKAAVTHFTTTVGESTLVPCCSLDQSDKLELLKLVVKKVSCSWLICWVSLPCLERFLIDRCRQFEPTEFYVGDVVSGAEDVKERLKVSKRTLVEDYCDHLTFSISGQFAVELRKEFGAGITARDGVILSTKFGNITKEAISESELHAELYNKFLDDDFPAVKSLIDSGRIKIWDGWVDLYIIVSVARLETDGSIKGCKDVQGSAAVSVSGTACAELTLSKGNVQQFTIPANTPIAYTVHKVRLSDSTMQVDSVLPDMEAQCAYYGKAGIDSLDGESQFDQMEGALRPLITMDPPRRQRFVEAMLRVISVPDVCDVILGVLRAICEEDTGCPSYDHFVRPVTELGVGSDDWQRVLQCIGMESKQEGSIIYPSGEQREILVSCVVFFLILETIDKDVIGMVCDIDAKTGHCLQSLLWRHLMNNNLGSEFDYLWHQDSSKKLLHRIIGIEQIDQRFIIWVTRDNAFLAEAVYYLSTALWK